MKQCFSSLRGYAWHVAQLRLRCGCHAEFPKSPLRQLWWRLYAVKDTEVGVVVWLCSTAVLGIFDSVQCERIDLQECLLCVTRLSLCTAYSSDPLLLSGWDVIIDYVFPHSWTRV